MIVYDTRENLFWCDRQGGDESDGFCSPSTWMILPRHLDNTDGEEAFYFDDHPDCQYQENVQMRFRGGNTNLDALNWMGRNGFHTVEKNGDGERRTKRFWLSRLACPILHDKTTQDADGMTLMAASTILLFDSSV